MLQPCRDDSVDFIGTETTFILDRVTLDVTDDTNLAKWRMRLFGWMLKSTTIQVMNQANQAAFPHVVIIGGGFGGLETEQRLRQSNVRVTLVDRHSCHLFQPLLYQVATGGLSPANIATPLRSIVRKQANCEVMMAEATGFDIATFTESTGKPLLGLASVAAQQGRYVAKAIALLAARRKPSGPMHDSSTGPEGSRPTTTENVEIGTFHYNDRDTMATIGRAAAVAQIGKRQFCGFFAWQLWLFVHLMLIVQFQNRVLILMQWAWSYATFNRNNRIIAGKQTVVIVPSVRGTAQTVRPRPSSPVSIYLHRCRRACAQPRRT